MIGLENGVLQFIQRDVLAGFRMFFHDRIFLGRPVAEHVLSDVVKMGGKDQLGIFNPVVFQNTLHEDSAGVGVIPFHFFHCTERIQHTRNMQQAHQLFRLEHFHGGLHGCRFHIRIAPVKKTPQLCQNYMVMPDCSGERGKIPRVMFHDRGKLQHGIGREGQ